MKERKKAKFGDLKDLIRKGDLDLEGFSIKAVTEVFKVDEQGNKIGRSRYFSNPTHAGIIAEQQAEEEHCRYQIEDIVALSNDERYTLLSESIEVMGEVESPREIKDRPFKLLIKINLSESIEVIGEVESLGEIKENTFAKISPQVRQVLKL